MERTVLVQVCSSGFVAFVSFQHITPDRLSQCLRCRGKGLGELIARSSQSPAQTTRYTSRSHTRTQPHCTSCVPCRPQHLVRARCVLPWREPSTLGEEVRHLVLRVVAANRLGLPTHRQARTYRHIQRQRALSEVSSRNVGELDAA